MKFVKLTTHDNKPLYVCFGPNSVFAKHGISSMVTTLGARDTDYFVVHESCDEILVLLAEPGPSVEATDEVVRAAWDAWSTRKPSQDGLEMMRAAIEAADRARGLRP